MRPTRRWSSFRALFGSIAAAAALCVLTGGVFAQAKDDDKVKIPEPEDVTFESKDGVDLHATFYPGVLKKKAIPFLMVHGWGGNRGQYDRLAKELQKRGNAVLAVDLRGHGESIHFKGDDTKTIDPSRFTAKDLNNMGFDLEAGKRFLMDYNNSGELNIEALCVVAAEEGAIPALNWTAADWSATNLPAYKQGHDVKAVMLLSPTLSFKGGTALQALQHPALKTKVAFFIACGKKEIRAVAESKKIHQNLLQARGGKSAGEDIGLFYETDDTNLQGTKLGSTPNLQVPVWVLQFVKKELVDKLADFAWSERRRP